jgi:hypothetical protein
MNRRAYIAGFGSLAAGVAVLGTAATTTFSANDRTSSVNIVADNPEGAIGFDIQNTNSEVINETGDDSGQVEIDLGEASGTSEIGDTGATGSGVNVGSVVNVGTIDAGTPANSEPSLKIINQTSSDNVEFTFDFHNVSGTGLGSSGLNLSFEFQDPAGNVEQAVIDATSDAPTITSGDGSGSTGALNNLDAGQVYDFALTVDADGATTSANISLDLDIIAVTP